jgi:tetratricopeptide (TPR) repeat protein
MMLTNGFMNQNFARLAAALDYHRRGDPAAARILYREVLEDQPRNFDALHLLGVATADLGDLDGGVVLVRRALCVEPRQPDANYSLARMLVERGEHALSYLLAGVLEKHDRSRFDVTALAWNRPQGTPMRQRLESAFERFVDVTGSCDEDVAGWLRDHRIDIAIDLCGHTRGHRTGIFARRPAPLQVSYLGFPATMGALYIDYIIADRQLISETARPHYAEQVIWMPESYRPNDGRRRLVPERHSAGLPPAAFSVAPLHAA